MSPILHENKLRNIQDAVAVSTVTQIVGSYFWEALQNCSQFTISADAGLTSKLWRAYSILISFISH